MGETVTLQELTHYAERFLADKYGFKLAIPVRINRRLRSTLGQYLRRGPTGQPLRIELSGDLVDYGTEWAIFDTLKHELIHYAVHCLGENWRDGADYFENELRKYGVSSTRSKNVGKYFITKCRSCGKEAITRVKRQIERTSEYATRCCSSRYDYIGNVIYNGEGREEIRFEQATA